MSTKQFQIGRSDGRSNQQVILDLVRDVEPGAIFTYDALAEALAIGSSRTFDRRNVQSVVRASRTRMLREHRRVLRNVAATGYKLAHAHEHTQLSLSHQRKGHVQMKIGLAIADGVRWDEMDEDQRKLHQAHLMIAAGMYQQMCALERRVSSIERAIRDHR